MLHGSTEKIDPNDSPKSPEHRSIEEAAAILYQEMYDLEFEDETDRIQLFSKQ